MRTAPANWNTIFANELHKVETKVVIDGVDYFGFDGESGVYSLETSCSLFEALSVGNCPSATITMVLVNPQPIPRMAKMEIYVRLVDGNMSTAWVRKGIFWIDTREWDADHTMLTITGYDAMLKADQPYLTVGDVGQWPKTDIAVVNEACAKIGVSLDSRSVIDKGYTIQLPAVSSDGSDSDSIRTVLGWIAALYGGNFIINDEGKLQLVPLAPTNNVYTGTAVANLSIGVENLPIYAVRLVVSKDAEYDSDTPSTVLFAPKGYNGILSSDGKLLAGSEASPMPEYAEFEVQSPWGTQAAADNLLDAIGGFAYQPYEATTMYEANPLWELGDGVTFQTGDGEPVYSVIARSVRSFGLAYTESIAAPQNGDLEHEYPYQSPQDAEIKREIAKTAASLRVDIDRIEGKVEGKITTYRQASVPTTATKGDLWYCLADIGTSYTADTWYRYNGSAWEKSSETIAVAPPWASGTVYQQGDVVESDGLWFRAKLNHTASDTTKPPNTTYWELCSSITEVSTSLIRQTMDNITLSVSSGSNGSSISLTSGGVTIQSNTLDLHVKSANIDGTITADAVKANTSITSPNIYGGTLYSLSQSAAFNVDAGPLGGVMSLNNVSLDTEIFKVEQEAYGHSSSTDLYLDGVNVMYAYSGVVDLMNIAEISPSGTGLIIRMASGNYWEIAPTGIFYKSRTGTVANRVLLANE